MKTCRCSASSIEPGQTGLPGSILVAMTIHFRFQEEKGVLKPLFKNGPFQSNIWS